VTRGEAPSFAEAAREYNARVPRVERVRASVVVRLSFKDKDGQMRDEQGEGVLQAMPPGKMALSVRKVGQPLVWIGCDEDRYWWFDLASDPKTALVGSHATFEANARDRVGLSVRPLDVVALLGLTELYGGVAGATQWSNDGRLLGIITPMEGGRGGRQRVWVQPETYRPVKFEWYDASGRPVAAADVSGTTPIDIRSGPGRGAMLPRTIVATDLRSGTSLRLDVSGAGVERIDPDAFVFDALLGYHGVDEVTNVDE
jgi:outer membrane lipoprotein-sorting protein